MKKFLLILLFLFFLGPAPLPAESITMTTYYPAPFGAYDQLRLVPRGDLTGACSPGTFYISSTSGDMRYCRTDGTWGYAPGVWKQVGNTIYPANSGNSSLKVGLGLTLPTSRLMIKGEGTTSSTSSLHIVDNADTSILLVGDDGKIGIGTSTPGYKLEVQGGLTKTTGGLVIETRASDPPSPETGQMWLRMDL